MGSGNCLLCLSFFLFGCQEDGGKEKERKEKMLLILMHFLKRFFVVVVFKENPKFKFQYAKLVACALVLLPIVSL